MQKVSFFCALHLTPNMHQLPSCLLFVTAFSYSFILIPFFSLWSAKQSFIIVIIIILALQHVSLYFILIGQFSEKQFLAPVCSASPNAWVVPELKNKISSINFVTQINKKNIYANYNIYIYEMGKIPYL